MNNNEVLSISDSDTIFTYIGQKKTPQTGENKENQGKDTSGDRNVTALRMGAGNADNTKVQDKAIADTYRTFL